MPTANMSFGYCRQFREYSTQQVSPAFRAQTTSYAIVFSVFDIIPLLQLRVLRFGFLQDGNVGVGVFPQREKIFVGG